MKRYAVSLMALAIAGTCSAANVSGTKGVAGSFAPGGAIIYTVVLTNSGPGDQLDNTGNEFTDSLPAGLTLTGASASIGNTTPNLGTNTVTWNGLITSGLAVTITINATINPATPNGTVISNTGVINFDADGNGTNESTAVTTTASFTVSTPVLTDVSIAKTGPTTVAAGANATYTITVTNAGPSTATGVTVTDALPGGTTFVSATPSQGSCTGTATVVCNLGSLANAGSATITLVIKAPSVVGSLSNSASVSSSSTDPNPGNNTATSAAASVTAASVSVPALSLPGLVGLALLLMFCGALFMRRQSA